MDTSKLALLLTQYQHRELPQEYAILSPAAEVSALLKEHEQEKQQWRKDHEALVKQQDKLVAEITTLAYLLDEAVGRCQPALEQQGLKRVYRELSVLKSKLVQVLQEAGYTWHNPIGEPFEGNLPDLVSVDGWRYGAAFPNNQVAQVREPIILRNNIPIKEGSVVVGAPETSPEASTDAPTTEHMA